jgi:hypothetical protein
MLIQSKEILLQAAEILLIATVAAGILILLARLNRREWSRLVKAIRILLIIVLYIAFCLLIAVLFLFLPVGFLMSIGGGARHAEALFVAYILKPGLILAAMLLVVWALAVMERLLKRP